jgi:hypothetical protein
MIHRLHASEATIGARNTANTADVNLTLRGENLFVDSNDGITIDGGGIIELKSNNKTALEVDENEASFYVPLKVTKTGQGNISDGDTTSSLTFGIRGDDDDAFLGYAWMEYDVNNGNVFNITGYDDGITTFNEISLLKVRPDEAVFLDNSLFFQKFTNDVVITPGTGLAYTFESDDGDQSLTISNNNIIVKTNDAEIMRFEDDAVSIQELIYNEKIHDLGTTSGTITPDVENGNVQTITLDGNLTFSAFSNPVAGQSLTLIIDTNGTGRTLTSTMKFAGASKTLSTTDTTDIISVFYDGTNYWASLGKGFA